MAFLALLLFLLTLLLTPCTIQHVGTRCQAKRHYLPEKKSSAIEHDTRPGCATTGASMVSRNPSRRCEHAKLNRPSRFHAIDNPVIDPISIRRAKSSSTLNKTPIPKSPSTPKLKLSSKWVPFSQRDSAALEKAYQVKRERTFI